MGFLILFYGISNLFFNYFTKCLENKANIKPK